MANVVLRSGDKVRRINGRTVDAPKGFPSWKEYWVSHAGEGWPSECRTIGCIFTATRLCCIKIKGKSDAVYIIPMCSADCDEDEDWYEIVKPHTVAVLLPSNFFHSPSDKGASSKTSSMETRKMANVVLRSGDKVRRINYGRTVALPKGFPSWKEYWVSHAGEGWPSECRTIGCIFTATRLCCIKIKGKSDAVYIIPMCSADCDEDEDWYEIVKPHTVAVLFPTGS